MLAALADILPADRRAVRLCCPAYRRSSCDGHDVRQDGEGFAPLRGHGGTLGHSHFVHEFSPEKMVRTMPIRAIIMPRLVGAGRSEIVPATAAAAQIAVAISTIGLSHLDRRIDIFASSGACAGFAQFRFVDRRGFCAFDDF
jgi:hypothetical protein